MGLIPLLIVEIKANSNRISASASAPAHTPIALHIVQRPAGYKDRGGGAEVSGVVWILERGPQSFRTNV